MKSNAILTLGLVLTSMTVPGVAADKSDHDTEEIRPLLAKYCFGCHGKAKPRGGLDLTTPDALSKTALWHPVRERLRKGEMPPLGKPQPSEAERKLLIAFSDNVLSKHTLGGKPDPGPLHPRRLNVREQRNVFRDLAISKDRPQPRRAAYSTKKDGTVNLYHGVIPPLEHPCDFVTRILPPDTQEGGFDTIGANLSIPPFLMDRYFRASRKLLDDCFSLKGRDQHGRYQWQLRELIDRAEKGRLPRGVKTRREAVVAFLNEFATRAFRRPVTSEELQKYATLFDDSLKKGESFEASIRLVLQAILVSPRFVILWNEIASPSDAPSVQPLSDYDLATRLSIFLWSSVPDRELWQLAEKGQLQNDKVLEQQVRRMLNDRRITEGFHAGFLCQWLQLDQLNRTEPDANQFPEYFQNNLSELMYQEALLFTDAILVEDRSILELIDTDWGFVCYPLAQHYGITNFRGKPTKNNAEPPWYRVKFTDRRRGGVLTMGKVLTGTSQSTRTSPVHRGKWVLETILGSPPPPPPPEVDNVLKESVGEGKQKLTVPQLLAKHRDNVACAACHRRIDPLGMAFENFDPTGRWREKDQEQPIDARGELIDGAKFNGIVELKSVLMSRKEEFVRCFAEQALTYALGRKLEFYDEPTVNKIVQAAAKDNYRISRIVVEVAKSYPFRYRRSR